MTVWITKQNDIKTCIWCNISSFDETILLPYRKTLVSQLPVLYMHGCERPGTHVWQISGSVLWQQNR